MSTAGFFLGGMLGRVAGPIAQDWFKYKTKLGREFASREQEAKIRISLAELENKKTLSELEHRHKLDQLHQQFIDARKRAEEQMFISRQDWQQKLFWEKCFPLRNPYELPLGYMPVYDESNSRLENCLLSTVSLPNDKEIVPLRIITAIKDSSGILASTINGNLSMFLVNYFASNGVHAVVSDIGSWKEEAPINDASINYLYKGAKGQPTMVIMPVFTNNGAIVRLKAWSWGLGEEQPYPQGFDFGWFNIEAIKRHILFDETKDFIRIIKESNLPVSASFEKDFVRKIEILSQKQDTFSEEEFDVLLSTLDVPRDIKSVIDIKTNDLISTIFSCMAGMHADSYHLSQYGTLPILPSLLSEMKGAKFMFPFVRDYYIALANAKLIEGVITPIQVIDLEFTLGEQAKALGCSETDVAPLVDNLEIILKKSENSEGVKDQYRKLLQRKSNLLLDNKSNNRLSYDRKRKS